MSSSSYSPDSSPHPLSVITIIAYVVLIVPTFYIWRRHGRPGFLAWNFVYALCAIRITGAALSIAAERNASLGTAAAIVNSIAISPLLLAALGVSHEARRARIADLNAKREWRGVWCLHAVVTTGMILVIVGIVKVVEDESSTAESVLIKAGMGVLVAAYVVLLLWTIVSMRQPFLARSETVMDGTILLRTNLMTLPFIGLRLVWGVVSSLLAYNGVDHLWDMNIIAGSMPEIVATVMFVIGGFRTRNMYA
ncbi:hypothetical protein M436DRAFT_30682, partial [Aureobasidium namibiae CBS 147.97]